MMCLPSIAKMTDQREATRKALAKSKTMTCDCCNEGFPTKAGGRYVEEYFSPLIADKPSGIATICPKCAAENNGEYGNEFGQEGQESGYFMCCDCHKLNIYNYSWEVYATFVDGEGYICQACAALRELGPKSEKWLESKEQILNVTKDVEALQAYEPKHLSCIGGEKKYPGDVVSYRDTPEYEADGPNHWFNRMEVGGYGGNNVQEIQECALEAFEHYGRVYITIAEAGQFQTYMDILVDKSSRREKRAKVGRKAKTPKSAKPLPAGAMPEFIART